MVLLRARLDLVFVLPTTFRSFDMRIVLLLLVALLFIRVLPLRVGCGVVYGRILAAAVLCLLEVRVAVVLSAEAASLALLSKGVVLVRTPVDCLVLMCFVLVEVLLVTVEFPHCKVGLDLHLRKLLLVILFERALLLLLRVSPDVAVQLRLAHNAVVALLTAILVPVVRLRVLRSYWLRERVLSGHRGRPIRSTERL